MSPHERCASRFRVSRIRPDGRSSHNGLRLLSGSRAHGRGEGLGRPPDRRASRRRCATRARSSRWRASRSSRRQETREVVFSILNDDQRKRFENNLQLDFAYAIPGVARFRVNCFFQRGSVSAAFRLVPQEIPSLDSLNVPQVLREFTNKPRGFVLVTGPTGSGKSTTLAAMIDVINGERQDHILTIEDPIEFLHQHKSSIVNQREVGADAAGLRARPARRPARGPRRHPRRRDARPGDDLDGADRRRDRPPRLRHPAHPVDRADGRPDHRRLPARAAGPGRTQLSIALQGIVTQQLLPTADGMGRIVACEVLVPTPAIRNLIREGKTHQIYAAVQTSGAVGMQTMDADLVRLVRAGKITRTLAEQRASVPEELKRLLGGRRPGDRRRRARRQRPAGPGPAGRRPRPTSRGRSRWPARPHSPSARWTSAGPPPPASSRPTRRPRSASSSASAG